MKNNCRYIMLGGLLFSMSVAAQEVATADTTVNRTVVVEQDYMPEVAEATKINVLPSIEQPSVEKSAVAYAYQSAPSTDIPAGKMAVINQDSPAKSIQSGFIRAGYGNRGNLDAAASFLFRLSARDRLSLGILADGMDGKIRLNSDSKDKWDARYYQTQANLAYSHAFHKVELDLAGHFDMHQFNYMPNMYLDKQQRFLSGSVHVGVGSTNGMDAVRFNAETNLLLYSRNLTLFPDKVNEYRVKTLGEVSGDISDVSSIAIGLEMNNLIYNQPEKKGLCAFENRTLLDLNPAYEYNSNGTKIRVGANVDLSFGAGKAFRISPDVEAQFSFADSYVFFLNATGGRRISDFRRLEHVNPYITDNTSLIDAYELVNASLGFKASPVNGLWFLLAGGYQYIQDDLYTGIREMESKRNETYSYYAANTDASNFFAQARLSYAFKNYVDFSAGFEYRKWKENSDLGALYLSQKPNYKLDVQLGINPFKPLRIKVGYNYLVRMEELKTPYGQEQKRMNNLYLSASYDVLRWLSVYTQMNNLLNDRYCEIPFIPAQGFNFVVGLRCQF